MKWIRMTEQGDLDVLKYEEAPIPEPGAGEVRVKIAAAGVNMIDTYQRGGAYKVPLPFTPGMEGAGTVDAVGSGVDLFNAGDRVAWAMVVGSYAEYITMPAERLVAVPAATELKLAAAAMLQGMTAHYLCNSTFPIQPNHTALVHAAAGGTGQLLVQMIKLRGGKVIGTVSTEEKAEIARGVGADEIIRYTEQDFEAEVKRLTNDEGVDVVYDSVGVNTFDKGLNCLRPRGYMVLYGQSSGAVPPFDPQTLNSKGSLFVTRPSLGHYLADRGEILQRAGDVLGWIGEGKLKVTIDTEFPLADAAEAQKALAGRQSKGKYLLIP